MNSTKQRLKQDSEAILSPLALQGVQSAPRIGDRVDCAIYSDKLPELLDARLMAMSPQGFMLTGFERVTGVEYAQSCVVSNFGRAGSRVDRA